MSGRSAGWRGSATISTPDTPPDVIQWREAFLAVELDGTWTRGTTIADLYGRYPDQTPNAQVAITLDAQRYWDLVLAAVDTLGLPADRSVAGDPAEARP